MSILTLDSTRGDMPKREVAGVARRGVNVCGYGDESFATIGSELNFIRGVFEDANIGVIDQIEEDEFRNYPMLSASNRFFTLKSKVRHEKYDRYPLNEDPVGALHTCALAAAPYDKHAVVKLQENEVLYFQKIYMEDEHGVP